VWQIVVTHTSEHDSFSSGESVHSPDPMAMLPPAHLPTYARVPASKLIDPAQFMLRKCNLTYHLKRQRAAENLGVSRRCFLVGGERDDPEIARHVERGRGSSVSRNDLSRVRDTRVEGGSHARGL
jgi:hypothetical protein